MIPIEKQIDFYSWQLKEIEKEWRAYYESSVNVLIQLKDCFLGEIYGFDESRGNIIVKFPKTKAPRLDTLFSFYYFQNDDLLKSLFKDFFKEIKTKNEENVQSLFHLNSDQNFVFTAIGNVDVEVFDKLIKAKQAGTNCKILLGKPEPPIKYLLRLRKFTEIHKATSELDLSSLNEIKLKFFVNDNKIDEVIRHLHNNDRIVIQGPPGTGKSTLIANLLSSISNNNKICIASLANKALVEIAKKIKDKDLQTSVYKSNLSIKEKKEIAFLKSYDKEEFPKNFILLTTYYKLSEQILDVNKNSYLFDYVIIEEASQAFYTTLIAFSKLAKKIIIIGDPMQLSPIVLNRGNAKNEVHLNIDKLINGLDTFMKKYLNDNYLLQNTYRLNKYNTLLTNSFYKGYLISENKKELFINDLGEYELFFKSEKTTNLWLQSSFTDKDDVNKWVIKFTILLNKLNNHEDVLEIAILTCFREDVAVLQELLTNSIKNSKHKVIVETIDKVQGISVDITFYLIRLGGNNSFVLNKNRFNVATSRAKYYNVIVIDKNYEMLTSTSSSEVINYFNLIEALI